MADQLARAAAAWPILTETARRRDRIEYGVLAQRIGIHVRPLRYVLGVIQDYCMDEALPPLTILVVNQSGRQGQGFIAWNPDDVDAGFEEVWKHNWKRPSPFGVTDSEGHDDDDMLQMLKDGSAKEVWRRVADRGVRQLLFRRVVSWAYGNRCAISGFSVRVALDAAHIVPWASCDVADRLRPQNGLLLTTLHHRLFDRGIITIDEQYRVRVLSKRPKVMGAIDRQMLWNLEGRLLMLPRTKKLWPSLRLIAQRNRALGLSDR